jgi:hypothetical protein
MEGRELFVEVDYLNIITIKSTVLATCSDTPTEERTSVEVQLFPILNFWYARPSTKPRIVLVRPGFKVLMSRRGSDRPDLFRRACVPWYKQDRLTRRLHIHCEARCFQ